MKAVQRTARHQLTYLMLTGVTDSSVRRFLTVARMLLILFGSFFVLYGCCAQIGVSHEASKNVPWKKPQVVQKDSVQDARQESE